MTIVTMEEAQAHLPELVAYLGSSEELIITLDQKQVAELLQISTVSVWQWEKKGLLQSYRIGNLKRFKLNEVLEAPKRIVRTKKGGAIL